MAKPKVVCIGAAAVDVRARPKQEILLGSSTPGITYFSLGGIARNMAENFARLDCDSYLLSMVGLDIFGDFILSETRACGVHTTLVERCAVYPTAARVEILDIQGSIQYGIFGASIVEQILPDYLERHAHILASADLLATHLLLPAESLTFLSNIACEHAIPLYINTNSIPLAKRALALLEKTPIIGTNQKEAECLAGFAVGSPSEAIEAGKSLLAAGAKAVIITLGSKGVVYCDSSSTYHYAALPAQPIDTTGAGDALCSGFLSYFLQGYGVDDSLAFGLAAAALTIESESSVNPLLSPAAIRQRMLSA